MLLTSCAHYRAVEFRRVASVDNPDAVTHFYAVAKNNVIIPEFVIASDGTYPQTKDEAWRRFQERRERVEAVIDKKYKIPPTLPYQAERITVMIGLIAVSPAVIPIMYVSDRFASREKDDASARPKASFKRTVGEYFDIAASDPRFYEPELRDEFEIVDMTSIDTPTQ